MNYTFKRHLVLNFQEVSSASVIADTKYHKKKGGSDNNKNNQAGMDKEVMIVVISLNTINPTRRR